MNINNFMTSSKQISTDIDKAKTNTQKALQNISATRALSGTDSANLVIADTLFAQSSVLEQGIANANDAIGILNIADKTLSNLSKNADHINKLSVKYNNPTINSNQRLMLQNEANAIKDSMTQSITNATFNGKNVFGNDLNFFNGKNLENLNLSSQSINANIANINVSDAKSIESLTKNIDSLRAKIGSTQNSLLSNISNSLKQSIALKQSESNLQNSDMAQNLDDKFKNDLKIGIGILAQTHNTQVLKSQLNRLLA